MSESYNGWTNWDTWNASLWLNNEEDVYSYFQKIARYLDPHNYSDIEELADVLEQELPELTLGDDYDPGKVNWMEVAQDFIE